MKSSQVMESRPDKPTLIRLTNSPKSQEALLQITENQSKLFINEPIIALETELLETRRKNRKDFKKSLTE